MPVIEQQAVCAVTIDGNAVDPARVLSAEYEEGFDIAVAKASVVIDGKPTGYEFRSPITLTMGATAATSALRFSGRITKFQYKPNLPSTTVTLPCEGWLGKAARYQAPQDAGTTEVPGIDLVNGGAGATDRAQVIAVLDRCGLAGKYTASQIGGLWHVLGAQTGTNTKGVRQHYVWKRGETGLSYIQKLDTICLGFRTFDSLGTIVRRQISPRPNPFVSVAIFTEGVDLFDDTGGEHDIDETANKVIIGGYDYGAGPVQYTVTGPHPKPDPDMPWDTFAPPTAPMIEKVQASDPGLGLSAREVAEWRLLEKDHVRLNARYSTWRDDVIRAGDTISLLADSGLEIYQTVFVRHVKGTFGDDGWTMALDVVAPAHALRGGHTLPLETWSRGAVYGVGLAA